MPLRDGGAVQLWEAGFRDLVCVVPPGATISKTSKIPESRVGKIPGIRKADGTWIGYPWLTQDAPSRADCEKWDSWGANVGILGTVFPAIDIDVDDVNLAAFVYKHAIFTFGEVPYRMSRGPRLLLMYQTTEPFEKLRLVIAKGDAKHAVEVLADGQQYLMGGTHPSGAVYRWSGPLSAMDLPSVSRDQMVAFLEKIAGLVTLAGYTAELNVGSSRDPSTIPAQLSLRAPNLEKLAEVVALIPNTFEDRERYIQMGCAIKAAAGEEHDGEALEIFQSWAARWSGGSNDPLVVEADWQRMYPPFRVGWGWLEDLAGDVGVYNAAADLFEIVPGANPGDLGAGVGDGVAGVSGGGEAEGGDDAAGSDVISYSDTWVVEQIARFILPSLRYVPGTGRWHVWSGHAWAADRRNSAEHTIRQGLVRLSKFVKQRANVHPVEEEAKKLYKFAVSLQGRNALTKVVPELQAHPSITLTLEDFDADPWLLNTPGGVVDLRTGEVAANDPALLLSKSTEVAPAREWRGSRWESFLQEATNGDEALQDFLQKQIGYSLTGSMQEQSLCFIHGPPLTGKSVCIEAISQMMGTYHVVAAPDTFAATKSERHPTDLAMLAGARLVTTIETQEGRAWDTQRIKTITGGDRMTARFMRQDFFEFRPTFKVIVVGNYEPEIKGVDDAMMRRLHIVPFTTSPKEVDRLLGDKLKAEGSAVLAWAIEGCARWLKEGLRAPEVVRARTEEYREEEDPVEQFIEERCEIGEDGKVSRLDLFHAWRQWCDERGDEPGTLKQLRRRFRAKAMSYRLRDVRIAGPNGSMRGYSNIRLREVDLNTIGR